MVEDLGFEAFVRAHASGLLRSAVLITGSRDAGEELLQATFTHLYPRWGIGHRPPMHRSPTCVESW